MQERIKVYPGKHPSQTQDEEILKMQFGAQHRIDGDGSEHVTFGENGSRSRVDFRGNNSTVLVEDNDGYHSMVEVVGVDDESSIKIPKITIATRAVLGARRYKRINNIGQEQ